VNIGFIGTGNMGRILIEALIESKAAHPSTITMTNRTIQKAYHIKKLYPELRVVPHAQDVVNEADLIFICVKPLDIHPLITQLQSSLTPRHGIISITSPLSVEQLEEIATPEVARAIPSITNRALSGVSLLTFGGKSTLAFQHKVQSLLSHISKPIAIDQSVTRVASDIVSCGPAFFSFLLQRFIQAAVKETDITEEQATILTSEMVVGMGKLLEKNIFTLPTLQEKVCVKGGVTGEGIKALEAGVGEMFEHVFQNTHEKYYEDIEKIKEQFTYK